MSKWVFSVCMLGLLLTGCKKEEKLVELLPTETPTPTVEAVVTEKPEYNSVITVTPTPTEVVKEELKSYNVGCFSYEAKAKEYITQLMGVHDELTYNAARTLPMTGSFRDSYMASESSACVILASSNVNLRYFGSDLSNNDGQNYMGVVELSYISQDGVDTDLRYLAFLKLQDGYISSFSYTRLR